MGQHPPAQVHQRHGPEPEILAHLAGAAGAGERLEQRVRPLWRLPDQLGELVDARRRESSAIEHAGQLLLRVGVRPGELRCRSGRMDALGIRPQLAALRQGGKRLGEYLRRRGSGALAQLLASDRGVDGIARRVLVQAREQLCIESLEHVPVDVEARFAVVQHRLSRLGHALERFLGGLDVEGAARGKPLRRRPRISAFEQQPLCLDQRVVSSQRLERRRVSLAPAPLARRDGEDPAAAERRRMGPDGARQRLCTRRIAGGHNCVVSTTRFGQRAAEQEAEPGDRRGWLRQAKLPQRALSGQELGAVHQRDHASHLGGADVREEPRAIAQWTRCPGKQLQLDIQDLRGAHRLERARLDQGRPPGRVVDFDSGQIRGRALPGARLLHSGAVHLHAPHANAARLRIVRIDRADFAALSFGGPHSSFRASRET